MLYVIIMIVNYEDYLGKRKPDRNQKQSTYLSAEAFVDEATEILYQKDSRSEQD